MGLLSILIGMPYRYADRVPVSFQACSFTYPTSHVCLYFNYLGKNACKDKYIKSTAARAYVPMVFSSQSLGTRDVDYWHFIFLFHAQKELCLKALYMPAV